MLSIQRLSLGPLPMICGFQICTESVSDFTCPDATPQSSRLSKKDLYFQVLSTVLSHVRPLVDEARRVIAPAARGVGSLFPYRSKVPAGTWSYPSLSGRQRKQAS